MNVIERMNAINAEQKIATFMAKEKENYDFKKRYAEIRELMSLFRNVIRET